MDLIAFCCTALVSLFCLFVAGYNLGKNIGTGFFLLQFSLFLLNGSFAVVYGLRLTGVV